MKMKINFGKIAFLLCNTIFLLSGICLVLLGCVLVNDTPRILLSRLVLEPEIISQPLLYYVALAFITAGLIVCAVAMLGCWASWTPESNWLMGTYIFFLIILLLAETSFGTMASLCPQIIGVASDRDQMVTGLMNNYGVPGRSQYTAAVDLAQTLFECCGMQSGSDYDGSKWWRREQESLHDLRVPHSCCFLSNTDDENSFLDPKPINSSLCQAKTNSRYQYGRHVKGCIDKLNAWFKDHVTIFLIIGLALVVVQLAVLLCAILVCLRTRKQPSEASSRADASQNPKSLKKEKTSERNLTPKPERKHAQIETDEDNGFVVGKHLPSHLDFHMNSKPPNYASKKLNLNEEFGDVRGRNSPSSLPLVLRNEHFVKYDEHKGKQSTDSNRRNSSIMQEFGYYDQGSNVYFTPHYRSIGRNGGRILLNNADEYKLNGELKNYFLKNDNYGLDNNSRGENKYRTDDCFEPEWVPSHQSQTFRDSLYIEPWNTVGIPLEDDTKRSTTNQIVRKVVRDIEEGRYSRQNEDRPKEIVEEKIDVTQARLYWQEKEKSQDRVSRVHDVVDYRTDYPAEGEREEHVIVLKVEKSDGVVLKSDRPIILTPVAPKDQQFARSIEKFKDKGDGFADGEKETCPDYEKNWNVKNTELWNFDGAEHFQRHGRKGDAGRMEEVASKVLKFESTGYPNGVGEIKPQIPRIRTRKICRYCKTPTDVERCPKCGNQERKTRGKNGKYLSLDSRVREKKNADESLWVSMDSQRSRTNFFGNTGSYTLRCNLNPVTKGTYRRKKFYLTPETLQLDYLKKLKEPKISYENFTARKREFKKHKMDSLHTRGASERKSDAGMW